MVTIDRWTRLLSSSAVIASVYTLQPDGGQVNTENGVLTVETRELILLNGVLRALEWMMDCSGDQSTQFKESRNEITDMT